MVSWRLFQHRRSTSSLSAMLDWQLPTSIHKDPELTQMCMDSSPKLGLISLFFGSDPPDSIRRWVGSNQNSHIAPHGWVRLSPHMAEGLLHAVLFRDFPRSGTMAHDRFQAFLFLMVVYGGVNANCFNKL